jgi:signal transduction histidine kinase
MNVSNELRWLKVILFFTITLLVMAVLYTSQNFIEINRNFDELDMANKAIERIDGLEISLYKSESLVRLYVTTQRSSGNVTQDNQKRNITELRKLMGSYPEMVSSLDTLDEELTERFKLFTVLMALPADTLESVKADMILSGEGLSNNIMRLAHNLKIEERDIVAANSENTMSGVRIMTMLVVGAILFSISLFLFAFLKLIAQIKREADVHVQLQRKNQELDRSNKELEQFAYIASHDLQEPLRKIHAYTGRLVVREKENLSLEGQEIIEKLQGFARRMQRLIDDLLSFSRMLKHTMAKKPVDLNKILNDTLATMSSQIQASDTVITAEPLPMVMGYESQLLQLIQNLVSNSIKYHKEGITPRITISITQIFGKEIKDVKPTDADRRFYKISFQDNGIGFDNENAERIFVIFQRLHGRSEYEGTGIGLAICKLVLQNHDGYISATGRDGEGADFVICLPVS